MKVPPIVKGVNDPPPPKSALPEIEALTRLDVKPGETLAVRLAITPSNEQADTVRQIFEQVLPGVGVVVFGPGVELQVVRAEES